MEMIKLACVGWCSCERDKYIWEDLYGSATWDEIIGRMYLLKVHDDAENEEYEDALIDFDVVSNLRQIKNVSSHCESHLRRSLWYGECRRGDTSKNVLL